MVSNWQTLIHILNNNVSSLNTCRCSNNIEQFHKVKKYLYEYFGAH